MARRLIQKAVPRICDAAPLGARASPTMSPPPLASFNGRPRFWAARAARKAIVIESMMAKHNAVAAARLVSNISSSSVPYLEDSLVWAVEIT